MPVMSVQVVIPAGGANNNILQGQIFEFLPRVARIRAGIVAEATAGGNLSCGFKVGAITEVEGYLAPGELFAGAGVDLNTQLAWAAVSPPGARLTVDVTNTDAANAHTATFYALIV